MEYSWPGNVRELENVIERAVVLSPSAIIGADLIPDHVRTAPSFRIPNVVVPPEGLSFKDVITSVERRLIESTLEAAGAPGTVFYTVPETKQAALPAGTVFPMMHTAAIIAAAEEGKRFVAIPIFDGTGDDGAQDSSVVITGWNPPAASAYPGLAALPSGRVRVAFYDRTKAAQNPDYEVGMRYWANGVADDLQMDFSDFVMQGKLSELTLPSSGC